MDAITEPVWGLSSPISPCVRKHMEFLFFFYGLVWICENIYLHNYMHIDECVRGVYSIGILFFHFLVVLSRSAPSNLWLPRCPLQGGYEFQWFFLTVWAEVDFIIITFFWGVMMVI